MQQVPNFGFVVFDSTQAVEKALAAKPILLYDNHRLNVEEKKMRQARPEGGFNDRDRQERANRGSQVGIIFQENSHQSIFLSFF